MRRLFGNIVSLGAVWVLPVAGEDLTKDRIERFLHAPAQSSVGACG
jgi:hypothetical protein